MENKKILVADDEPDTIEFVTAIIEDIGDYSVLTASNGQEAIEIANAELPDLIILDVMMPKKDGYTAFNQLKQDNRTSDIPVIMLSNLNEMGDMVRGNSQSIPIKPKLFVDKPIEPDKLKNLISRVLESK